MALGIESALLCYSGKVCVEPSLMSASASEGQGQFFLVLQPVGARPNSVQPYPLRDVSVDHGCVRAMNPDMGPESSSDPDITMVLGGN